MSDAGPVTEILFFPTTTDFVHGDGWRDTRITLRDVSGVLRQSWGTQVNDVLQGVLLVNWDSMSSRTAFPLTSSYPEFVDQCMKYITIPATDLQFQHAFLCPDPPTSALTGPFVEISRLALKEGEDKDVFQREVLDKLVEAMSSVEGCTGSAAGPTHEDPNVFFIVNGWNGLLAHKRAVTQGSPVYPLLAQLSTHAKDFSGHFYALDHLPDNGEADV